ncbi:sigma-54-dependent Fis family transcriptional regulator [Amycolatopsis antarctica]|uniref:sigma-54-dependent Fis family transcriptional regulator n=1 Tax=Amycolatopsis antarctica TaxID=1854586 RepID=UPI001F0A3563|nr:GAF domain-containing protein [Amycolatopsis antarctica]
MTGTPRAAAPAGDGRLARARVRFLTDEQVDPHDVRDTILASWWRSQQWNVTADRVQQPYVCDLDTGLPLTRSAEPILRRLSEHLDGQSISVILTDQSGVVLSRITGDGELNRHLDTIRLAPGFSYAEEFVGTNGIGTALEAGAPMHVFGHEHYAEYLDNLACAGAPIQHPITGKTVGAVDLTCWRRDADPLLITLARTAADQIRQALLLDSGVHELELFHAYLQACRRTNGMVLAVNDDVVIMNHAARQLLDPADQSVLLGHAVEVLTGRRRAPVLVDLPTGRTVRMACRPVRDSDRDAGGIVHVSPIEPGQSAGTTQLLRMFLPGIVGAGALWIRACHEVDRAYRAGEWLVLGGEPGAGKLALAKAVHHRYNAAGRLRIVDAADADGPDWISTVRSELTEHPAGALVVRRVDRLDEPSLEALTSVLREARSRHGTDLPWVAVTQVQPERPSPGLADLCELFPCTVEIPPLRHHVEDLRELVPFLLSRLSSGGALMCSQDAMQLLLRSDWPGNVEQLFQVLKRVVRRRRRTGSIQAHDLPAEYHTVNRRALTPLEAMERDAIVRGLLDSGGNKVRAATALGMSRATIYRKIHDYGIVLPHH